MTVNELVTILGFRVDQSGAKQYEEVFNRIKGFAIKAAAAIGLTELAKSIIETTSAWQEQNLQLSYIIGNTEKAHRLMLELNSLAANSPFSREDLASYAKQLINFGFGVNEITPLMSRLANIAAVLGKDSIPLIVESLARMKTRGYADARVIMELFHAGIPIQQELAKRFGVTTFQMNKLIQEGRVGFRDVYDAITQLTTGTGKFAGAANQWSQGIAGGWHQVQHIIDDLKLSLGTSLLPVVEKLLTAFRNWLEVNKGHLADDMIKLLNTIAYTLGWIIGRVQDFLKSLGLLPDKGPKPADTSEAAGAAAYKPTDPLSRILRGESLADIAKNPTGAQPDQYAARAAAQAIRNRQTIQNLKIDNRFDFHFGAASAQSPDALKKAVEEGANAGLLKAIREAAPSFTAGGVTP